MSETVSLGQSANGGNLTCAICMRSPCKCADTPTPAASAGPDTTAADLNTTDGMVWAREFVRLARTRPEMATDESWMVAWFANAIERGRSAALRSLPREGEAPVAWGWVVRSRSFGSAIGGRVYASKDSAERAMAKLVWHTREGAVVSPVYAEPLWGKPASPPPAPETGRTKEMEAVLLKLAFGPHVRVIDGTSYVKAVDITAEITRLRAAPPLPAGRPEEDAIRAEFGWKRDGRPLIECIREAMGELWRLQDAALPAGTRETPGAWYTRADKGNLGRLDVRDGSGRFIAELPSYEAEAVVAAHNAALSGSAPRESEGEAWGHVVMSHDDRVCGEIYHGARSKEKADEYCAFLRVNPTLRVRVVPLYAGRAPAPAVSEEAVRTALMVAGIAYTARDGTFYLSTETEALGADDAVRDIVNTLNGKNGHFTAARGADAKGDK